MSKHDFDWVKDKCERKDFEYDFGSWWEEGWEHSEPLWETALKLAEKYHKNFRVGKNGERLPYTTHLREVMRILSVEADEYGYIVLTIAALHDILEDTDCAYEELERKFGAYVAGAVRLLTRREGEPYGDYAKRIFENTEYRDAGVVKLADRLHNLRTLPEINNPGKIRGTCEDTEKCILPYADNVNIVLAREIRGELEKLRDQYM